MPNPNYGTPDCAGESRLDDTSAPGVIVVTCDACSLHYTVPQHSTA